MIIDGPIAFDMTFGSERRIPQDTDAQVEVPSRVNLVTQSMRLTQMPAIAQTMANSWFFSFFITRTNVAGVTTAIMTLLPGLWELEIMLATWSNFVEIAAANSRIDVEYVYSGNTQQALSRILTINSFTDIVRNRLLLNSNLVINLRVPLTGVAQTLEALLTVNAVRVL